MTNETTSFFFPGLDAEEEAAPSSKRVRFAADAADAGDATAGADGDAAGAEAHPLLTDLDPAEQRVKRQRKADQWFKKVFHVPSFTGFLIGLICIFKWIISDGTYCYLFYCVSFHFKVDCVFFSRCRFFLVLDLPSFTGFSVRRICLLWILFG